MYSSFVSYTFLEWSHWFKINVLFSKLMCIYAKCLSSFFSSFSFLNVVEFSFLALDLFSFFIRSVGILISSLGFNFANTSHVFLALISLLNSSSCIYPRNIITWSLMKLSYLMCVTIIFKILKWKSSIINLHVHIAQCEQLSMISLFHIYRPGLFFNI